MDQHGSLKRNDDHWTLARRITRDAASPRRWARRSQALEIAVIYALSPQAKGRVERLWGTLQDRLVSELRLTRAPVQPGAGERGAGAVPSGAQPALRDSAPPTRYPRGERCAAGTDLERLCSFSVRGDRAQRQHRAAWRAWSSTYRPDPASAATPGQRIELRQLLDASWRVYLRDTVIATADRTQRRRATCAQTPSPAPAERRLGGENSSRPTGSFRFPHRSDSRHEPMRGGGQNP